jgi:hypothetical protein
MKTISNWTSGSELTGCYGLRRPKRSRFRIGVETCHRVRKRRQFSPNQQHIIRTYVWGRGAGMV